jgi:hypothetical protein
LLALAAQAFRVAGLQRDVLQWQLSSGQALAAGAPPSEAAAQPHDTLIDAERRDSHAGAGSSGLPRQAPMPAGSVRIRVSTADAGRVLASCALREQYFDLIDVDSFGSDTSFLGAAIAALQ